MKLHKILILLGVSSLVVVLVLASVSPALAANEQTGTVKWFNDTEGYGFIGTDSGADFSVQSSAIEDLGDRYLEKGDRVEFPVENGPEGPQATNVRLIVQ